jgi:hypothetical protein
MQAGYRDPATGQVHPVTGLELYQARTRAKRYAQEVAAGKPDEPKRPKNRALPSLPKFGRSKESPFYRPYGEGRERRRSFADRLGLDALAQHLADMGRTFAIPVPAVADAPEATSEIIAGPFTDEPPTIETAPAMDTPAGMMAVANAVTDAEVRRIAAERGCTLEEARAFIYDQITAAIFKRPEERTEEYSE